MPRKRLQGVWTARLGAALACLLLVPMGLVGGAPIPASGVPTEPPGGNTTLGANATAVVASGSWNCGQGEATVDFFGRGIGGAAPYQYLWDFGDASPTSASQDPVHSYPNANRATATLVVTDSASQTARTVVNATWSIPQNCVNSPTTYWGGILLYVALVVGVAAAVVLLLRRQRLRRPPP
jgi:hypothetical protein